jgi:hypothetical protein
MAYAAAVDAMFPAPVRARSAAGRASGFRKAQMIASAPNLIKRTGISAQTDEPKATAWRRASVTTRNVLAPAAKIVGELENAAAERRRGRERCAVLAGQLDNHMRQRETQAAAECGRELALLLAQCADRPAGSQVSGRVVPSQAESERLASLCRLLARLYLESDETDEALGAAKAALCLHPDSRAHWTSALALQRAKQLEPAANAQLAAYALGRRPDEAAWLELLRELQRTRHYHSQVAPKQRPNSGYRRAGWHGRGDQGEGVPLRPAPRATQRGRSAPSTAAPTAADDGPARVDGAEHAAAPAPARAPAPAASQEVEAAGARLGGTRGGTATLADGARPRSRLTRVYSGFA